MKLVERISQKEGSSPAQQQRSMIGGQTAKRERSAVADGFQQLKLAVHNRLFETLDVSRLESLEANMASQKVTVAISEILDEEGRLLTDADRARLIEEIKNELLGLGPLEPLLWDDEITDILVNGPSQVYVERGGKLYLTDVSFQDDQHLMLIIDRIVSQVGRRVDEASPMVDARLPDGSRINAVIPPLALDGPAALDPAFRQAALFGRRSDRQGQHHARHGRVHPRDRPGPPERAGLRRYRLGQNHDAQLYLGLHPGRRARGDDRGLRRTGVAAAARGAARDSPAQRRRQGRSDGSASWCSNTLRMRPDRIIVGEVRGGEVFDMLQAMSTGHDGSLCTIHANTPRDSMGRLEMMMLLAGWSIPQKAMRQQIASALNVIVHVSRLSDGTRKVMKISELVGMEGEMIMMQDLYEFHRTGVNAQGKVLGQYRKTGIRSAYKDRIEAYGYNME